VTKFILNDAPGKNVDLRTGVRVICEPNLQTKSAFYT